jgi:membrane protein DedA with SNARE-associated domain
MEAIISWLVETIGRLGYIGIIGLMALESSIFPVPSELVIPPAGYLAAKGEMNIFLVIITGTLGSLIGALFNYLASYYLGRPFIIRYGKYFLIPEKKFEKIETYFRTHGEISTFTGRLIVVVRHLISLPAGLAKMDLMKFCIYTALGSALWVTILACIGYLVGNNPELVKEYSKDVSLIVLASIPFIIIIYLRWFHKKNSQNNKL